MLLIFSYFIIISTDTSMILQFSNDEFVGEIERMMRNVLDIKLSFYSENTFNSSENLVTMACSFICLTNEKILGRYQCIVGTI